MAETSDLTKEQFIERYVAHTLKTCGFTKFDDGADVESYARQTAESYWDDPSYSSDGPEGCAEGDMEYWGEE